MKLSERDFRNYLEFVREKLGHKIFSEKKINYGHQFVIEDGSKKCTLNIYNGKKGLNPTYAGDSSLAEEIAAVLTGKTVDVTANENMLSQTKYKVWAGSDESGKGDFFGSLVVAATVVDETTAAKLAAAGVKDCKLLTDKKILELEEVIKANVVDFSVLELKPKMYNLRYEQVAAQGGKLNQLLGNGHVVALSQVLARHPECEGALIDQFTTSTVLIRALKSKFPSCDVRQQPKAESDLAVAAASVLARAKFLHTMADLAAAAGAGELPKGGGEQATAAARALANKFGKEALCDYVKLHFANYGRV